MAGNTRKTVLENGVRVLSRDIPHARSLSMGVWVNVGARDETLQESGISHFIEHMIFKGTTRRTAYQIAKEFDAIGGQTNAFTAMENTCYHARVLDTHLETMIAILSDIFLNSTFEDREVERERMVILQEIGMVEDSPEELIHQLSSGNHFKDDPLGRSILGTPENIAAFTGDSLRTFFTRRYRPDRIVISIAGSIDHDRFIDLIAPLFGTIPPGETASQRTTPGSRSSVLIKDRDSEQLHICLSAPGLAITDDRRFALSLANTIIGGNMSSRLFQQIRENRGLAYSVYSFVASFVDTGMFGAYAAVDPQNVMETIALMMEILATVQQEPISTARLQDAKEYTKGSLLMASESIDNQMVRLAQNEINFNRSIALDEVIDRIERVSADDLCRVATDLFRTDAMALTVLGPASRVDGCRDLESTFPKVSIHAA